MANSKNNKSTKVAEELIKRNKSAAELAKRSEVASVQGQTETFTVKKGTQDEYPITLRFPGVADAWRILESDTKDASGTLVGPAVLENAINAGLIVAPKITSIDFWNTHKGLYEAATYVVQFLTERLN